MAESTKHKTALKENRTKNKYTPQILAHQSTLNLRRHNLDDALAQIERAVTVDKEI